MATQTITEHAFDSAVFDVLASPARIVTDAALAQHLHRRGFQFTPLELARSLERLEVANAVKIDGAGAGVLMITARTEPSLADLLPCIEGALHDLGPLAIDELAPVLARRGVFVRVDQSAPVLRRLCDAGVLRLNPNGRFSAVEQTRRHCAGSTR